MLSHGLPRSLSINRGPDKVGLSALLTILLGGIHAHNLIVAQLDGLGSPASAAPDAVIECQFIALAFTPRALLAILLLALGTRALLLLLGGLPV
jgi:hypothetical protein